MTMLKCRWCGATFAPPKWAYANGTNEVCIECKMIICNVISEHDADIGDI